MTFTYTDASGAVHYLDARVSYANNPVAPTVIMCGQCGGQGYIDAATFGDHGWHPCYRCGTTGQDVYYVDMDKAPGTEREDGMPDVMRGVAGPWRKYYPNAYPARVELSCAGGSPLIARGVWECCQGCANGDGCYRQPEPHWL